MKRARPSSSKGSTETEDVPARVRRSKRVKQEVKYETDFQDIKEEEYAPEDHEEDDPEEDKENVRLEPKRGTSRGSKYSKAKTVMVRGVKSVITDKESIVSVKFNDAVPVDIECPLRNTHRVIKADRGYYDVMLNQTNIASNNNKYYILQILENRDDEGTPALAVWFRWGRVGHINGTMLKSYSKGEMDDAINDFSKKFFDKTKNEWCYRDEFCKVNGKYDLVLKDYDEEDLAKSEVKIEPESVKVEPCDLDQKIQDLIAMISDVSMMENCVKEMKFDIQKAPLGKLSKKQIDRGFEILKKIEEKILGKKHIGQSFEKLSSQYYTQIPHDFGFSKMSSVYNMEMLTDEIELLKSLEQITIAINLNHGQTNLHPLTKVYNNLHADIQVASGEEFEFVKRYLAQSHGETHTGYELELSDLFSVQRESEEYPRATKGPKTAQNTKYLWHGSRTTNFGGILSRGLCIAPPSAPVTGYMFGKGVYFADCASKSANYCHADSENPYGLLLLCKVALGKTKTIYDADDSLPKTLPKQFKSITAIGKNIPSVEEEFREVSAPCGRHKKYESPDKCSLLYNEYVVYDTKQIQIDFIAKVKFNYGDLW